MKKITKILLIIVLSLVVVLGAALIVLDNVGVTYTISEEIRKNDNYNIKTTLENGYTTLSKVNENGEIIDDDIKVMAFTDIHLDHKEEKCTVAFNLMIRSIVKEKPDFVVFLGDNITSALNKPRLKEFCETLEDLGVYWACVLGNHEHDNTFSLTRSRMINIMSKYEHSLVDPSKKKLNDGTSVWGNGNYAINLKNSNGIYRTLIFLDGGQDATEEDLKKYSEQASRYDTDYDYIKESQVKWYEETIKNIKSINNGTVVKSTIFCHIPLQEFTDAYNLLTEETKAITTSSPTGSANDVTYYSGARREGICCGVNNTGMFAKMKELGSTDSFYSGHDHINDFVLEYQGIILGYCTSANYSSYNLRTKGISATTTQGFGIITYNNNDKPILTNYYNSDLYQDHAQILEDLYGEFVAK